MQVVLRSRRRTYEGAKTKRFPICEMYMTGYNKSSEFGTPTTFFNHYNRIFNFDLDVAASDKNHKCDMYFTEEQDGLKQNWGGYSVWCNPPYGRQIHKWVRKCYEESLKPNTIVVALLPSRTDTKWFQEYVNGKAIVQFVKGRLHFNDGKTVPHLDQ